MCGIFLLDRGVFLLSTCSLCVQVCVYEKVYMVCLYMHFVAALNTNKWI